MSLLLLQLPSLALLSVGCCLWAAANCVQWVAAAKQLHVHVTRHLRCGTMQRLQRRWFSSLFQNSRASGCSSAGRQWHIQWQWHIPSSSNSQQPQGRSWWGQRVGVTQSLACEWKQPRGLCVGVNVLYSGDTSPALRRRAEMQAGVQGRMHRARTSRAALSTAGYHLKCAPWSRVVTLGGLRRRVQL